MCPLFKGIKQQIKFLLGTPLPNKFSYECNPSESKELQGQVQELLDRGYIRESLSLCLVSARLVPNEDRT